jgi:hypothetical protein
MSDLVFTKSQVINEKSRGAFNDPAKERIFRLSVLGDWLTMYDIIDALRVDLSAMINKCEKAEADAAKYKAWWKEIGTRQVGQHNDVLDGKR